MRLRLWIALRLLNLSIWVARTRPMVDAKTQQLRGFTPTAVSLSDQEKDWLRQKFHSEFSSNPAKMIELKDWD